MRRLLSVLLIAGIVTVFQTDSMAQTAEQAPVKTRKTVQAKAPVSAKTIRQNMQKRLAKLEELKKSQKIAEANTGYLIWIKQGTAASKEEEQLINAENADRKTIYTAIAKQQKSTVDNVGKRRAAQLRKIAKKGHYCMDEKGKLYLVEKDPEIPARNKKKAASAK